VGHSRKSPLSHLEFSKQTNPISVLILKVVLIRYVPIFLGAMFENNTDTQTQTHTHTHTHRHTLECPQQGFRFKSSMVTDVPKCLIWPTSLPPSATLPSAH